MGEEVRDDGVMMTPHSRWGGSSQEQGGGGPQESELPAPAHSSRL